MQVTLGQENDALDIDCNDYVRICTLEMVQ